MGLVDTQSQELKSLFRSGIAPRVIARRVGCSVDEVIRFAKKNRLAHATDQQRRKAVSLLRKGMSVRQVGHAVGMSHTWVVKLAEKNGIPLNRVRLDSQQRSKLTLSLMAGDRLDVAAKKCGCSKSTASEYRRRMIDRAGEVEFRNTRRGKAQRCPVHGLINVVPCVACAATRGQ